MSVHVLQIQIGVLEHEAPRMHVAASSRDWPPEIRRLVERELAAWRARNPTREIVGATHSFSLEGQCVVEFEHAAIGETRSGEQPAPPQQDMFAAAPAAPCTRCGE